MSVLLGCAIDLSGDHTAVLSRKPADANPSAGFLLGLRREQLFLVVFDFFEVGIDDIVFGFGCLGAAAVLGSGLLAFGL